MIQTKYTHTAYMRTFIHQCFSTLMWCEKHCVYIVTCCNYIKWLSYYRTFEMCTGVLKFNRCLGRGKKNSYPANMVQKTTKQQSVNKGQTSKQAASVTSAAKGFRFKIHVNSKKGHCDQATQTTLQTLGVD